MSTSPREHAVLSSLLPSAAGATQSISHLHDSDANDPSEGYYYDNEDDTKYTTKSRSRHKLYINIHGNDDDDDRDLPNTPIPCSIFPPSRSPSTKCLTINSMAKIKGVMLPQFNGKHVQLINYNHLEDVWTVQFQHFNHEARKFLNIRAEFLIPIDPTAEHSKSQQLHKKKNSLHSHSADSNANKCSGSNSKQWRKAQTCGYYILLALIVISCTCLLLTPFWSFSSLIFGQDDGYIYYLSYTLFCGAMCCIIWNNKINVRSLLQEMRHCNLESVVCWIFYLFCCILLWGMASYFGGFFFIYLWYCSQEINSADLKRVAIFDGFMKYTASGSRAEHEIDSNKRAICVYFYCLMNYESNMHRVYRQHVINAYLLYESEQQFVEQPMVRQSMMNKQCFANCNFQHNLPFILGIAGYHFMIWFGVFYLSIRDWSFLITVCNDVLLLVCILIAVLFNLCWHNRCRRQINLQWLKYFNLENVAKESVPTVIEEVDNLYRDLNERLEVVQLVRANSILPEYLMQLLLSYLYVQDLEHQLVVF